MLFSHKNRLFINSLTIDFQNSRGPNKKVGNYDFVGEFRLWPEL